MSCILPLVECGGTDVPSKDETPCASLIRAIYTFLDQSGYINVGIVSEKDKAELHAKAHYRLSEEKITDEGVQARVADSEDGVSFILGQLKCSENLKDMKNNVLFDDANLISEATKDGKLPALGPELSNLEPPERLVDYSNDNVCGSFSVLSFSVGRASSKFLWRFISAECGVNLNLRTSQLFPPDFYFEAGNKGTLSFVVIDDTNFRFQKEDKFMSFVEVLKFWGIQRNRTKIKCDSCGHLVGYIYEDGPPLIESPGQLHMGPSQVIPRAPRYRFKLKALKIIPET